MKFFILAFYMVITFTTIAQNTAINNTIVVKTKPSYSKNNKQIQEYINNIFSEKNIKVEPVFNNFTANHKSIPSKYNLACFYKINLSNEINIYTVITELNSLKYIEYAEPYPVAVIFDQPDDTYLSYQYYLQNISTFDAFDITHGDTNIVIGIVDSGVDLLHEDLKENYKYNHNDTINNIDDDMDGYVDNFYGWDVADNNNNPQSLVNEHGAVNYHGTKVAGIASAVTANATGIAGVGYNTKILPVKTMDSTGYIVAGYEGIVYAADHGCDIINCSWGSNFPSKFAQEVINYAAEYRNCLIVAAAGNKSAAIDGRPDTRWYPASYKNVLSVAATDVNDILWSGSSFAPTVDVCAPGKDIFSTYQFSSYKTGSGTSYASPIVAGAAALLKAVRPELTQRQLAAQLRITSDVIDTMTENSYYAKQIGYGRINIYKALTITNMPAVEIDSVTIISNKKNGLLSGDTLYVTFSAENILSQVSNTIIRVTTNSEFIEPINNFFKIDKLNTFESVNNFNSPLVFKINNELPVNSVVWFTFEMKADGYDDFMIYEDTINKNYLNISKDDILTTFTSNGRIGFADENNKFGCGLMYKNNNLLANSGIILATSNSTIASSLFNTEEFNILQTIDSVTINGDITTYAKYKTSSESGMNIEINQTSLLPTEDNIKSTIIHIYKLINTSDDNITGVKLSQFIDWNLYDAFANKADFNNNLNLFYTYTSGQQVLYTGICLLNNMSVIPYGFDLISGGNGGIDITQEFSNDLKWIAMTNSRPQAGNNGDSINIATMLTTDYFNIKKDDTVEIAFAEIIGNNYNDLINKTVALKNRYNSTNIISKTNSQITVFPNPATDFLTITRNNTSEKLNITIYNQTGQLIFTRKYYSCDRNILIDISNFKKGIYIIKLSDNNNITVTKFIKR